MTNFRVLARALGSDWHAGHRIKTVLALHQAAAMQDLLLIDATCPCCGEQSKCASDCRWAENAPGDAARMAAIRAVLEASP